MSPTQRDPDGTRHVGPSWESLVERQIREAMEDGRFDALPHQGTTLPSDDDAAAGDRAMAFKMLRDAGVLQHPMGHRPFAPQGVVVDRQPLALVGQIVESTVVDRLTDLPLDHRLAHLLARWFGGIGALGISLPRHAPSVAHVSDRQAVAPRG